MGKIIRYLLAYPLFLLSRFFPKDPVLWIFGSWKGTQFNDNSKYLFEYINRNHPGVRAVWLTKSAETVNSLRANGYECYHMYSPQGVILALRARVAFLCRSKVEDLPVFLAPAKTKIIQLWHGTPLKKLGRDSEANKPYRERILSSVRDRARNILFPYTLNRCSAFIVSSKEVGRIIESAYGNVIDNGGIKVTGYPRNDALFQQASRSGSTRLGIYLPTFRDSARDASKLFLDYGFDSRKAEKLLAEFNAELHVKFHPESVISDQFRNEVMAGRRIKIVDYGDLYAELGRYDFLITDYSSVYFDYLLLDRPVIFSPFDLEAYMTMRGMYFDYNDITPGIRAFNWDQVLDAIVRSLENPGEFKEARRVVNERLNTYCDNQSCRRVYEMVVRNYCTSQY